MSINSGLVSSEAPLNIPLGPGCGFYLPKTVITRLSLEGDLIIILNMVLKTKQSGFDLRQKKFEQCRGWCCVGVVKIKQIHQPLSNKYMEHFSNKSKRSLSTAEASAVWEGGRNSNLAFQSSINLGPQQSCFVEKAFIIITLYAYDHNSKTKVFCYSSSILKWNILKQLNHP